MCVINDSLGLAHSPASSVHYYSYLESVLFFKIMKRGEGQTGGSKEITCKNSDHYRPRLWFGLVDQKVQILELLSFARHPKLKQVIGGK